MEQARAVRYKEYKCGFCGGWHVAKGLMISPQTGELNGGSLPSNLKKKMRELE
jgi:hypothetical protein